MKWFFLTSFSLAVFNVILLILFMIYYLWRIQNKTTATRYLLLFLSGVLIVFFSFMFIFSSVRMSYTVYFWWLLHTMIFASAAMVQFSYHFLENPYPRESNIVGKITLGLAFIVFPYYVLRTGFLEPAYNFDGHLYVFLDTPEVGIVIGIQILWVIVVLIRKSALFSKDFENEKTGGVQTENKHKIPFIHGLFRFYQTMIRILRSNNKKAAAMRNFTIIFISPVILIVTIVMAYLGFLSWEIVSHILGSGFVIFVFIFIVLYINYSAEPSTFMIKLLGICLGTVLITLGLVGQIALIIKDKAYDKERILEKKYCKCAVRLHDFSELPESIVYIATYPVNEEKPPEIVFNKKKYPHFEKWLPKSRLFSPKSTRMKNEDRHYRYIPEKNADKYIVFYTFIQDEKLYEIGYRYIDYRRYIHESSRSIFYVTGGAVLFIMMIFPVFFRESLIRPLNCLLDGVRRVNEGNLTVVVPVFVHDEIGFLSSSFNRMVQSVFESEKDLIGSLEFQEKLTVSYSYFVPKQLLKLLDRQSIIDIRLGDNIERKMTILFSDIRSFTSLSEQMTPEENFNFINNFLKRVGPVIRKHNGYVDKYIGDGIMAIFPDSPVNAIKASIEMQLVGHEYNDQLKNEGLETIRFGIGAHTGVVMLGTIGEEKRMEGTVISDAVNLAARLEGLTKIYGAKIVISKDTLEYIKTNAGFQYRYLDRTQVKGKKKWVDIFEILDAYPQQEIETRLKTKTLFESASSLYFQKKFQESIDLFTSLLAIDPTDKAAKLYIHRCRRFIEYGTPPDWNGLEHVNE